MTTKDMIVKFRVDGTSPDGTVRRLCRWINLGDVPSADEAMERWLDWCRKTYPGGAVVYRGGFPGSAKYMTPEVTVHFRGLFRPMGCLDGYEEVPYEACP